MRKHWRMRCRNPCEPSYASDFHLRNASTRNIDGPIYFEFKAPYLWTRSPPPGGCGQNLGQVHFQKACCPLRWWRCSQTNFHSGERFYHLGIHFSCWIHKFLNINVDSALVSQELPATATNPINLQGLISLRLGSNMQKGLTCPTSALVRMGKQRVRWHLWTKHQDVKQNEKCWVTWTHSAPILMPLLETRPAHRKLPRQCKLGRKKDAWVCALTVLAFVVFWFGKPSNDIFFDGD